MQLQRLLFKITIIAFICILGMNLSEAHAAMDAHNTVDRILRVFHDNTANWQDVLLGYALRLFWLLAGIEFTWTCIQLALKGADFSDFLGELVKRIMAIGIPLFLLLHSADFATAIVQSFRIAANMAGSGHSINPANILDIALDIVSNLLEHSTVLRPMDMFISSLCAISILICFALMAANMIEALIESYIVISAGVILMGFAGSSWTNEFSKKYYVYAISVGLKLFLIQLMMGLGETLVAQLASEFDGGNLDDALVMVGIAVTMWIVTLNIPNKLQALINGTSLGAGGTLAGIVTGAVGAALATASGTAAAAHGAYSLASEKLKDDPNHQSKSMPARLTAMTKEAFQSSGSNLRDNLGQRFRGEVRHGNMGGQVGTEMSQAAAKLRSAREERDKKAAAGENSFGSSGGNRLYPQQNDD